MAENAAAIVDVDNMDFDLPTDDQVLAQINQQFSAGGMTIDIERFRGAITLYPVYFDRCKSLAEGRRLPMDLAVPTDPCASPVSAKDKLGIPLTCWHLARACQQLQLQCLVEERKRYPRNHFAYGRVRVIPNGAIKTKSQLMKEVAKLLPSIQVEMMNGRAVKTPTATAATELVTEKERRSLIIQFEYSPDPFVRTMLMYGQGLVPELITSAHAFKQRQNENMEALGLSPEEIGSSPPPSSSNKKKGKKNRK